MTKDEKPRALSVSYAEYEMFLTELYNYVFPPLLHKSLTFYIWFFTEKEPTKIFSKNDILEIINILEERDIDGVDALANAVQSFPIPDAIVVKEAISYRISQMGGRDDKYLIAHNKAKDVVFECLKTFSKAMS